MVEGNKKGINNVVHTQAFGILLNIRSLYCYNSASSLGRIVLLKKGKYIINSKTISTKLGKNNKY